MAKFKYNLEPGSDDSLALHNGLKNQEEQINVEVFETIEKADVA